MKYMKNKYGDENGNVISFWSTDDNVLCKDSKTLRENLNNKADKNGVFTMANMGQDIKEAMTGGSVAVVGKDAVLTENIADNQVTPEKTTFIVRDKSINLFDKSKVATGLYYGNTGTQLSLDTDSTFMCIKIKCEPNTQYIASATSYNIKYVDSNNIILGAGGSGSSAENVIFTTPSNCSYFTISYKPKTYDTNKIMVCKGNTLPSNYVEYYTKTVLDNEVGLNTKHVEYIKNQIQIQNENSYYVGESGNFATLTECLNSLKDNDEPKTIYIQSGSYNIFEEIGGSTFALKIDDTVSSWRDVSVVVPPNTKIIGLGNVILNFYPSKSEISTQGANLLSCLNIIYKNCTVENITIICGNCRYGIHDETGGDYPNSIHKYKNVRIFKESYGLGYSQAFGCGFSKGSIIEFNSCYFEGKYLPFSCHNNNGDSNIDNTIITAKNSIFNVTNATDSSIRFGNVNSHQVEVLCNFENCFIRNGIDLKNETSTERPNAYNLTLLKCGNIQVNSSTTTNIYEPKIFN